MTFNTPSFFAGIAAAVGILALGFGGGVMMSGVLSDASRAPNKIERQAARDTTTNEQWMIDATPDFPEQLQRLGGRIDGILLTHAHIGHYLGLAQLGREVMGTHRLPVYATRSMAGFVKGGRSSPTRSSLQ